MWRTVPQWLLHTPPPPTAQATCAPDEPYVRGTRRQAVSQAFTRVPPMLRCDTPIHARSTRLGGLPAAHAHAAHNELPWHRTVSPPAARAPPMRLVDAYCGTGGWSAGAIAAGCTPVLGIDCDHTPLQLWAANCAPAGRAACATLGTDEPVDWPAAAPDVHVHLSPPCTSLSKARAGSASASSVAAALEAVRWCVQLVLERGYASWSLENVATPAVLACVAELARLHPVRVAYVVLDAADYGVPSNRVRLIASTPEVVRALKEMPVRRVSVADAFAAAGLPLPAQFLKSNTTNRDGSPCVRSVRPPAPPLLRRSTRSAARPSRGAGAAAELHRHRLAPAHLVRARRHDGPLLHRRRVGAAHGLRTRLAAAAGLARRAARGGQRRAAAARAGRDAGGGSDGGGGGTRGSRRGGGGGGGGSGSGGRRYPGIGGDSGRGHARRVAGRAAALGAAAEAARGRVGARDGCWGGGNMSA